MAVIKKDATAARIQGHKNSQQQGEAFILQTQRMYHLDFAAQSPPLTEERSNEISAPQLLPLVFPVDGNKSNIMNSVVPEGAQKRLPVRAGSVLVKKRDPSKHMLSTQKTRQRSKSAMDPPKSKMGSKIRAVSISATRSSRNILAATGISPPKGLKTSGSRTDSTDSLSADRSSSFKRRFLIFKKRMPSRAHSQALFNEPSYEMKNGIAELSPENRAENERRASMQLRDKRRLSVGASSHVQFEVGGDQASVYEVKLREVNLVKRLASGPLSEVYAAIWRDTKVGVKLLMPREGVVDNLEEAVKNFRREIWVMHALKHPNIVKLLGASLTQSCYVLIMEYMPNGSLYDYLRDTANFFPHQLIVTSAFDIASGMAHIHACDVPLQVANEGLRPSDFTNPAPLGLEQLMHQCWDADPEQRPSFEDISQTLGTWLRTQSNDHSDEPRKSLVENDGSVDLSAHIQRGQITATQAELHRFAESHDANAKVIPITLSSLRRGLSTSRLQRNRTKRELTASEIEEVRVNSTLGIPGLEEFNNSNGRVQSSTGWSPRSRRATPPQKMEGLRLEESADNLDEIEAQSGVEFGP
ncbi:hypothetical protein PRNP1_003335 [Phytophthora ramorum]